MVGEPRRALASDVDQRDFGRSATDVKQHYAFGIALDKRTAARNRKPCLGLAIYDLQRQPSFHSHPLQELRAVFGRAACLCRDQPGLADRAVAQFVAADLSGPRPHDPWPLRKGAHSPSAPHPTSRYVKMHRSPETGSDVQAPRLAAGNCWCRGRARQRRASRKAGADAVGGGARRRVGPARWSGR